MSELNISTDMTAATSTKPPRTQSTHWVAIAIGVCLICLMRQTVFSVTLESHMVSYQDVSTSAVQGYESNDA
ncbi:MAG: hypothetical protein WEB58_22170 [Planctomycetaceae bacterium]